MPLNSLCSVRERSRFGHAAWIPLLAGLALASTACGSSKDDKDTHLASADAGGSFSDAVGRLLDGPKTCTEPHTICVKLQVPADIEGPPETLQFPLYDSAGAPAHPPNGFAGLFPNAAVEAGEIAHFELTDAGFTGTWWLFTIMYMPGGGAFTFPVIDVDYVLGGEPAELVLDGSPVNVATPIQLRKLTSM